MRKTPKWEEREYNRVRNARQKILAGSVVVLPASPIGLCEKAGIWGRETRIEREREEEKKTEREFLWLGMQHRKRRGLLCVYSVRQWETSSLWGHQTSDLLLFHFVFCSLYCHNTFCHNQMNKRRQNWLEIAQLMGFFGCHFYACQLLLV